MSTLKTRVFWALKTLLDGARCPRRHDLELDVAKGDWLIGKDDLIIRIIPGRTRFDREDKGIRVQRAYRRV